jgi:hypothetical protein
MWISDAAIQMGCKYAIAQIAIIVFVVVGIIFVVLKLLHII